MSDDSLKLSWNVKKIGIEQQQHQNKINWILIGLDCFNFYLAAIKINKINWQIQILTDYW